MVRKLFVVLALILVALGGAANAQVAAPTRIVIAFPPGGSYDIYSRLAAAHMTKYIPGRPNIIAFPPGGPVDFVARVLADGLSKELGTTVLVDNKPGGNGAISAQAVINAKPDGNTLWFTSAGAAAINPGLYEKLTYKMSDMAPVSLVVNNVEVLVTQPNNPARTTADLVAQSKQRKDPTAIASSGIGSMPHLAMELLASSTGANLLHVPYKGAAPAITDVMADR